MLGPAREALPNALEATTIGLERLLPLACFTKRLGGRLNLLLVLLILMKRHRPMARLFSQLSALSDECVDARVFTASEEEVRTLVFEVFEQGS